MFRKILKCDYQFDSPWWDDISENAKVCLGKLHTVGPSKQIGKVKL